MGEFERGFKTCVADASLGDKVVTDFSVSNGPKKVVVGTTRQSFLDWVCARHFCLEIRIDVLQVHVDNVASAHILAERALSDKPEVVCGQIYNIGSSFSPEDKPVMTHSQLVGDGEPGTLDHWGFAEH
jgi:hypothetical protein